MDSIRLSVPKVELLEALRTLSSARRRRFSSSLPVWLDFDITRRELRLVEDHGRVAAGIPASGSWPPAGATVDLFMMKRAVATMETDEIELHVLGDAVAIYSGRLQVRLHLLAFGPESRRGSGAGVKQLHR